MVSWLSRALFGRFSWVEDEVPRTDTFIFSRGTRRMDASVGALDASWRGAQSYQENIRGLRAASKTRLYKTAMGFKTFGKKRFKPPKHRHSPRRHPCVFPRRAAADDVLECAGMWRGGAQSYQKILGSRVAHEIRIYVQRTLRCTYLLSGTRI